MKKVFRALGLAAIVVIVALVAGTLVPRPFWPPEPSGGSEKHRILVLTNPIHTDIAVPIDAAVFERFGFLIDAGIPADLAGARYLVFGWGGRDFYLNTPTWSDLKPMPLLRGLTLDDSVLHVDVTGDIPDTHPAASPFWIGDAEFTALLAFIDASFQRGPDGPIAIPDVHYGTYDRFFEASGNFTALLGCNTWTAKGLREAGLRTGWWNPLPATLRVSLDLYN